MASFVGSCLIFLANCVLFLIEFVAQHVFRIKIEDSSLKSMKRYAAPLEPVPGGNEIEEEEEEEEATSTFSFKFEYQTPKFSTEEPLIPKVSTTEGNFQAKTTNISNYQFESGRDFSGFVEEPAAMTFQVHESFADSSEENQESKFISGGDFQKPGVEAEDVMLVKDQELDGVAAEPLIECTEEEEEPESNYWPTVDFEKPNIEAEDVISVKDQKLDGIADEPLTECNEEEEEEPESNYWPTVDFEELGLTMNRDVMFVKDQKLEGRSPAGTESFSGFDSDSDSASCSDGYSVQNLRVDSDSDGVLSERELGNDGLDAGQTEGEFSSSSSNNNQMSPGNIDGGSKIISEEKIDSYQSFVAENRSPSTDKFSESDESQSEDAPTELKVLNSGYVSDTEFPSLHNVNVEFVDSSDDDLPFARKDLVSDVSRQDEASKTEEEEDEEDEEEDLDELESLWEHQDLIEQLKMELKRVRAVGLPTIYEESESPKEIEDLKPWKFDEKFLREDPMDELHKFYKSYRERMRKFDILNYQKMYAVGFLQLKNPLESLGTHKPSLSTIISQLSQNLKPLHRRRSSSDPSEKFLKELQVDLETVYVGQTCLSWEFLRWQYEKARELPESDPYRSHQYNHVAGEFQQFQVIVQRFVENESFEGPRLQNYVKNRCVLRNLLQVPVIKEDCLKEKMEEKKKGNYAITSEMLEDIMEECIRVFWDFVKADKDETSMTILKGLIKNPVEFQEPSDSELMSEIQATLQKKEKKLKDILKTGNCLVKKFKKPREDRSNQDLFFSQVDMRLVSRVLKMSRITTDQLVWCHMKLEKITFKDHKIVREPSFLLFPC